GSGGTRGRFAGAGRAIMQRRAGPVSRRGVMRRTGGGGGPHPAFASAGSSALARAKLLHAFRGRTRQVMLHGDVVARAGDCRGPGRSKHTSCFQGRIVPPVSVEAKSSG